MKTPITKARLSQHRNYNWWKYLLVIVGSVFLWNMIYSMTRYRPPAEKVVDLYVANGYGDQTMLDQYLENIRTTEMTDMEEMQSVVLTNDEYYGAMQLTTYVAAGEGDVYILPADTYRTYAANGTLVNLDDYPELLVQAREAGIAVDKGQVTVTDTGERHVFGLPTTLMTGLNDYNVVSSDSYICLLITGGNDDNAALLISKMIRDMIPQTEETATPTDLQEATVTDLPEESK